MGLIKELKEYDECFYKCKVFVPLFNKEIEVLIENVVEPKYAEECAENIVNLSEDNIEYICSRAIKYYEYMLEEWGEYDIYDGIVESIKAAMPEKVIGKEILKYITSPIMYILNRKKIYLHII